MKIVEFAPAARAELDAAADRYELERPGRGQRFYAAVERAVNLIAAFPAAGPAFPDIRPERGARRRIVRGFPFVLAYRVLGDTEQPRSRIVDVQLNGGVAEHDRDRGVLSRSVRVLVDGLGMSASD